MYHAKWLLLTIGICSLMIGCGTDSSTSLVPKSEDQEYLDAEAKKAEIQEAPAQNSV